MELDEAIKTAIDYESKVHRTYVKAMEAASSDVARRVFKTLRDEEREHLDYLRERLQEWNESGRITVAKLPTAIPNPEAVDQAVSRLREKVGAPVDDRLSAELESLKQALEVEDETSRFYQRMVSTLDAEGRQLFQRFVEIEQGHKAIVQAVIDCISGSGYWFDTAEISLEMG